VLSRMYIEHGDVFVVSGLRTSDNTFLLSQYEDFPTVGGSLHSIMTVLCGLPLCLRWG
jgi:hypothetical protein